MNFSDEYVSKLSKATGVCEIDIRSMESSIMAEIRATLLIARELEPSGRITKKLLKIVLKERTSCQFV